MQAFLSDFTTLGRTAFLKESMSLHSDAQSTGMSNGNFEMQEPYHFNNGNKIIEETVKEVLKQMY